MFKVKGFKILILVLTLVLVLTAIIIILDLAHPNSLNIKMVEVASAAEVYPLFECPCCGEPIDECTCGMAQERRTYIDGLVDADTSEDKVILAYVKRYGLDSFISKDKEEEFREKLAAEAPLDRAIIFLSPEIYDFGDVSQKRGTVEFSFELENKGQSDLIIERLETSCGCTSAAIVYQGKKGPMFNMPGHGTNEKIDDWSVAIAPGDKAELKVYYDPNVHLDFRGAATRTISVFSNDPIDSQKKVQIELNQTD